MTITDLPVETRLDIRPLSGVIGAEIHGIDLREQIDDATIADLRTLWLRYQVIFFPGQHLSPEQHRAFAARFGELTPAHPVIPGIDGGPPPAVLPLPSRCRH